MRIALVDDNPADRSLLRSCLEPWLAEHTIAAEIEEFGSGDSFLAHCEQSYDLVFMDIEMPGENGMEVAAKLRRRDEDAILIFVTNIAGFAIHGYEVGARDYIVKPLDPFSFKMKMSRTLPALSDRQSDALLIKTAEETVVINRSNVLYLEAEGHFVHYHLPGASHRTYGTFKNAIAEMRQEQFEFCNRCYYVNLRYVKKVDADYVYVGEDKLLISRPKRKAFLVALANYVGRGKKR